jgi:hypothetical protein
MTEPHLTEEELSAHLDGEPGDGPSVAAHLAGCAPCRATMADLEFARTVIRTPVPPVAPDVRAASIAAVLRRAEDRRGDSPVPIRSRRGLHVLMGAAAAVLILVVAIGIPASLSTTSSSNRSSTASRASAASTPSTAASKAPVPQSSGFDGLSRDSAAVSNLGTIGSVQKLRSAVAGLAVGGAHKFITVPAASSPPFEGCLPSALRAASGRPRPVTVLAVADYKAKPALVYVFGPVARSTSGNQARSVAVAVATSTCRLLIATTL